MWILVQVGHETDVGVNEKKRYLMSESAIKTSKNHPLKVDMSGYGTITHPATSDINQMNIEQLEEKLYNWILSKNYDDITDTEKNLLGGLKAAGAQIKY